MPGHDKRVRIDVRGVVQGVGFRPYVFDLATRHGLSGHVSNNSDGVLIEVQGPPSGVDAFARQLPALLPPLAFVVHLAVTEIALAETAAGMQIRASQASQLRSVLLPPDVCICDDCLRELRDPSDRRFHYPFINCTNCGPRYTIIDDIPYDRPLTSMARFPMCDACRREYEDPRDRRFHAQPNACPVCGPRVWLCAPDGSPIDTGDPIAEAARRLAGGQIAALKGLGGFHLAADARNDDAVRRLRARKHRDAKPLALMCRDVDEAASIAVLDAAAQELLTSRHRPIVLVPRRPGAGLAESVAPGHTHVGVMLPYTPLHAILLGMGPPALVMTSGNISEEPIAIANDEALERLAAIADVFVMHDRDILVRNDDSVAGIAHGRPYFLRRSRGYVPLPIVLAREVPCVLAVGADLKNTVCLTRGSMAFVSQHVGDQANLAAFDAFRDTIERLQRILAVRPGIVAADLNPDTMPSQWADGSRLPLVRVQHHHAHIASCLAEHGYEADAIGVALDGVGLGTDGAVWGGELLIASQAAFRRAGHLGYVRQPGGDRASQEPWRMAISHLVHAFGDAWEFRLPASLAAIAPQRRAAVAELVRTGIASPWTSSAGRLFDAVSALCGLVQENLFEAKAAMELEAAAYRAGVSSLGYEWSPVVGSDGIVLDPGELVRQIVEDLADGGDAEQVAARFHAAFARGWARACGIVRDQSGLSTVALSGGCMQNRVLTARMIDELEALGFQVLTQERVPPNDGGLSLGQAVVAAWSPSRAT